MPSLFAIAAQRRDGARCAVRRCLLSRLSGLLSGWLALAGATQSVAAPVCRPSLTIKHVEFSEMLKPTLERKWSATVIADGSRCATTAGYFQVGFSRIKEYGPDLEFREEFIWSTPSVKIGLDFAADEAVQSYWIDSVQECPCAD